MRWIDRGPEPAGVVGFAEQYTHGWIAYHQNRVVGLPVHEQPRDSHWQQFRPTLAERSNNNCWYCERQCRGVGGWAPTVDHFLPRSHFPELTYKWSNWIFSCRRCNVDNKQDRWPEYGYVDPAAIEVADRPEQYFEYDPHSGRIIAKPGISDAARRKAWATIDQLGLSKSDLVNPRFSSIRQFEEKLAAELLDYPPDVRRAFIDNFLSLSPADRVDFLISSASANEQTIEYPGLKAMVAEKLLRDNRASFSPI